MKTEHENRKGANGTWDKVITAKRKDQKTGRKGKRGSGVKRWQEVGVGGGENGKKGGERDKRKRKGKKRMWGVLFTISLFNVLSLKTHKHSQRMYLELTRWYFLQKNSWLWHMCVCALSATLMLIGQSCDLWWTYVFRGQFVDFLCALYLLHNLHKQTKNVHECNTLSFSSVFSLPGEIFGFVGSGFSNNFFTENRCWQKSDVKLKIEEFTDWTPYP